MKNGGFALISWNKSQRKCKYLVQCDGYKSVVVVGQEAAINMLMAMQTDDVSVKLYLAVPVVSVEEIRKSGSRKGAGRADKKVQKAAKQARRRCEQQRSPTVRKDRAYVPKERWHDLRGYACSGSKNPRPTRKGLGAMVFERYNKIELVCCGRN